MASVSFSGAGSPLEALNLMPQSFSGPPGLCDADMMKPPDALRARITALAAGVHRKPSRPTYILATPLPAASLMMICAACLVNQRPSPPSTMVAPSCGEKRVSGQRARAGTPRARARVALT